MKLREWMLAAALSAPVLLASAGFRTPLPAQEGASLAEVESLAAQGRIMEARETLETWWTGRFSAASRADRERGIWLRGKLTVDPSMAEMDYRRLVLEFPGGPYTDDALFRLGLAAELRGDLREASSSFESLLRDYPASPRVPEARAWLRAHAGSLEALPSAPSDPTAAGGGAGGQARPEGEFAVQLGAFRSLDGAGSLVERLREAGHDARLVRTPGNDLAKVRVGRFSSREAAEALARELRAQGFEVTLVMDAGSEERVGRSLFPPEGDRPVESSARPPFSATF